MPHRPSRAPSSGVAVLDAAYAQGGSLKEWAAALEAAVEKFSKADRGVVSGLMRMDASGVEPVEFLSSRFEWIDSYLRYDADKSDERVIDAFFRHGGPIIVYSDIARKLPPDARDFNRPIFARVGATDAIGLRCALPQGVSFWITAVTSAPVSLGRADRRRLTQIALHIETAARARLATPSASAVLSPTGKVLHAEGRARDAEMREELAERVRLIEGVRSGQLDEAAGLAAWKALVDGEYSVVEHEASGAPRTYVALENPPETRHYRALSPREAKVLELSARGLTGKSVAYSLGISEATVSEALANAAAKAGVGSRTRAVALAAALLAPSERPTPPQLTSAEREVLDLLARGLSNDEIARERGRSERTVANQVASLLRKTGASSRRALIAGH